MLDASHCHASFRLSSHSWWTLLFYIMRSQWFSFLFVVAQCCLSSGCCKERHHVGSLYCLAVFRWVYLLSFYEFLQYLVRPSRPRQRRCASASLLSYCMLVVFCL